MRTVKAIVIGLSIFLLCSCGDSGGGSQTVPKINNVEIYDIYWNVEHSFLIGEYANFAVSATDPDMDMKNLLILQYWPSDNSMPYYGPAIMALPSQSGVDTVYYPINPLEVTGPVGTWRIEFQIEDSYGNESNVFTVYILVS